MVRTHTLVEYRLKEYELEQAFRSLKQQQEKLDYKLDVEFYLGLEALAKDFGYSFSQVYDLVQAKYLGETNCSDVYAVELKARTNTELLELIQRFDRSPPSTDLARKSVNPDPQSCIGKQKNQEFESGAGQLLQDPGLSPSDPSTGYEYQIEEKLND